MHPPDPFPPPPPGTGYPSAAQVAARLAGTLARHGIAGIYTATTESFAVISVTTGLTAWTDGRQIWCTHDGQRRAWPATDIEAAAARLATLARPASTGT